MKIHSYFHNHPTERHYVSPIRVGAAQTRPRWLDRGATTDVVVEWIAKAAAEGLDLVAFGEVFLSGYPVWLAHTGGAAFDDPAQKRAYAEYLDQAVVVPGPEINLIREAVGDHGVTTVLGVTERGRGSGSGFDDKPDQRSR